MIATIGFRERNDNERYKREKQTLSSLFGEIHKRESKEFSSDDPFGISVVERTEKGDCEK